MNKFLALAAFFGMLAVMIGAFGAHGLEDILSEHAKQRYQTGVSYQFYHVAALLVIGVLSAIQNSSHKNQPRLLTFSGMFFVLGILLFSGSLYLYALTGKTYFGIITPVGGLSFIAGWLCLLVFSMKSTNSAQLIHKQ